MNKWWGKLLCLFGIHDWRTGSGWMLTNNKNHIKLRRWVPTDCCDRCDIQQPKRKRVK